MKRSKTMLILLACAVAAGLFYMGSGWFGGGPAVESNLLESAASSPEGASENRSLLKVKLFNAKGDTVGEALLVEEEQGVRIQMKATGLEPGKHGFHIHENAIQGTDFAAAGGHFNPKGKEHGLLNPKGSHLGDMPNIIVGKNGKVEANVLVTGVTLKEGEAHSIFGRSLMIHAEEDDQMTDPSGKSGARVVGGNIS